MKFFYLLRWFSLAALVALTGLAHANPARPAATDKFNKLPKRIDPAPLTLASSCIKPDQTVTLMAVGDVLLHDTLQKWASQQSQGFYAVMQDLQDLLSAADVTVANLEGPAAAAVLPNGHSVAEPASRYDASVYRGYPMFNYHPSIISDLKRVGVDVLQTANNHALDRRSLGVDRTIEAIQAQGLAFTGTRHSRATHQNWHAIHSVQKGAQRFNLAYLACTYGTNGLPDPQKQVLQCYQDKDTLLATVRQLSAQPDVHAVVVLPHWGQEYQPQPNAAQMQLAREMARAGATAIIGTHPHVVQPMEVIDTAEGTRVPVVYSLGNFMSHQIGLPQLSSLIYMLALAPNPQGKLVAQAVGWIPLLMKTGPSFSIQALDRLPPAQAAASRDLLLKTFSAEHLHAAQLPLWSQQSCKQ